MTSMNDAKKLISALISKNNIVFCHEGWSADYRQDWDDEFSRGLRLAFDDLEKLIADVEGDDDVLSQVALTMARIRFLRLSDFFLNIHEDFERLLAVDDYKGVVIPDGYEY
ncbi:hypothetical protein [Pseudomonas viridiflava]